MSRRSALARLAAAYGRHEVRRRFFRRPQPGAEALLTTYRGDGLVPLTPDERDLLPEAGRCINCGLCALVAARVSGLRPPDLAAAYLRDYPRLSAAGDWAAASGEDGALSASLEAVAAACPTGVPLPGVLAMVTRLASR